MPTPPDLPPESLRTESPLPPPPNPGPGETGSAPEHLESALAVAEGATSRPASQPSPLRRRDGSAFEPMPRDEWCKFYVKVHTVAGNMMDSAVLRGVEYRAGALDAAGAIYDTCLETPMLWFFIDRHGKWFERATLVGMFYLPLADELRKERHAKLAAARAARAAAKPAAGTSAGGEDGRPPDGLQ